MSLILVRAPRLLARRLRRRWRWPLIRASVLCSTLIGGTAPLSGEAFAAGAARRRCCLLRLRQRARRLNGRKIDYKVLDDGDYPPRTVEAVRELLKQDHVFAVFNSLGTSTNLVARDFLNQSRPQLFVASGATTWGRDHRRYPWTIGYILSYQTEAIVPARNVLKTKPRARVAVLYQDDEYGNDLLAGLRRGLGVKKAQLAKAVGYDPTAPDVDSQVAELRVMKATVFMVFASASSRSRPSSRRRSSAGGRRSTQRGGELEPLDDARRADRRGEDRQGRDLDRHLEGP